MQETQPTEIVMTELQQTVEALGRVYRDWDYLSEEQRHDVIRRTMVDLNETSEPAYRAKRAMQYIDGFGPLPDALNTDTLTVRCTTPEYTTDSCDGWETTVEIDPSNIRVDRFDRVTFPVHVPTECSDCGGQVLDYNGFELNFHA